MSKGYSLLELLVVVGIITVITSMAVPAMQLALLRANISAVATDAKALHQAFKRYHIDHSMYPPTSDPAFELGTLEPLVSQHYYDGRILAKIENGTADGYDSPDDHGLNQEFWLELSLDADPTVRFLIADSDDAPLSGGYFYDGIFLYRNGVLTPLTETIK